MTQLSGADRIVLSAARCLDTQLRLQCADANFERRCVNAKMVNFIVRS
jgi:hypothetical protein